MKHSFSIPALAFLGLLIASRLAAQSVVISYEPLLPPDQFVTISWPADSIHGGAVNIDLLSDNGNTWLSLAKNYYVSPGSFQWMTPHHGRTSSIIRISDASGDTLTSSYFGVREGDQIGVSMSGDHEASALPFPNPARAMVTIPIVGEVTQFELYNEEGQPIRCHWTTSAHLLELNTLNMPSGNYRYAIQSNGRWAKGCLVISR